MAASYLVRTPAQLGEVLRGFRQQRRLTQQALASRLGLPQKAISMAETHSHRLTTARLFQILGALQVELRLGDEPPARDSSVEW